MKRIVLFALAVFMTLTFVCACGGNGTDGGAVTSSETAGGKLEAPTLTVTEEQWRTAMAPESFLTVAFEAKHNGVVTSKGIMDAENHRVYGYSDSNDLFEELYLYFENGENKGCYRSHQDDDWTYGDGRMTAELMAERMSYIVKLSLATRSEEPYPDLSSLYSSFTFDENDGVYRGTVTVTVSEDGAQKEDTLTVILAFADGHLMMIETQSAVSGDEMIYTFSSYGTAKVTLPWELAS